MTKPLTNEEVAKVKEAFAAMDSDGDGKISHGDLQGVLTGAGWTFTDAEVKELISRVDKDNTGSVTYDEFLKFCQTRPVRKRIEAALRNLFAALDADGSGYITSSDLINICKEAGAIPEYISEAEIKDAIKQCDKSGDGKVSFDEFVACLQAIWNSA